MLSAIVVVVKLADLQFDPFFYAGASIGGVILLVSRHRFAFIAAAFAWLGFRLTLAGTFAGKWWAFGLGALFVGVAYAAFRIAGDRKEYERIGGHSCRSSGRMASANGQWYEDQLRR